MIDPLNQSPGQTEKVPATEKGPAKNLYTGTLYRYFFIIQNKPIAKKGSTCGGGAVRAVSTGGSSCCVLELAWYGTNVPYCVQVTCTKCIICMKYSYS